MWRKIGVTIIALVATFSVVYGMNRDMSANATVYNAGGTGTGRIGKAPANLTLASGATNIGMQKGDKVLLGVDNQLDGTSLGFQLIFLDTNYKNTTVSCVDAAGTTVNCDYMNTALTYKVASQTGLPTWYSMSSKLVLDAPIQQPMPDFYNASSYTSAGWIHLPSITGEWHHALGTTRSTAQPVLSALNNQLSANTKTAVVRNRDLTYIKAVLDQPGEGDVAGRVRTQIRSDMDSANAGGLIFNPDFQTVMSISGTMSIPDPTHVQGYSINIKDLYFSHLYTYSSMFKVDSYLYVVSTALDGVFGADAATRGLKLRPTVMLEMKDVVFATSMGVNANVAELTEPKLSSGYTSIYEETKNDKDMKIRLLDSTLTVSLQSLKNQSGTALTVKNGKSEIATDMPLALEGNANAVPGSVVSALLFDTAGNFKYYRPIEASKGSGLYVLDTTDIPVGEYQIAIVNEMYDESTTEPSTSSLISNVLPLRIVQSHKLVYTATPQNQVTYEYDKNVEAGQKVGTITRSDGVVPITYKLLSNSDDSYKNFEIIGLGGTGESSATSLEVKIKATGAPDLVSSTNSLKAGTYKFCVESRDVDGNPVTQFDGHTKVCPSITVNKTKPTITFAAPAQKVMKTKDTVSTDTVTTTNTDIRASGDITYTLSNGIGGVLTAKQNATNFLAYDLSILNSSHSGIDLPTTFTLNATIKETANYLSATTAVNRPVFVYKEMEADALTWTPLKTPAYISSEVVNGKIIGDLVAKDGVGPFTYTLTTSADTGYVAGDAKDNSSFAITGGTGVASGVKPSVKTTTNLALGTYKMQFKVIDSKGKIVYTKASIEVSAKVQSAVDFKDKVGGTIINNKGITMKFNDEVSLFAEGGTTTLDMEYYVAKQADQPGQLNPADYLTVTKGTGALVPKKVGTVKVYATRPGDGNYGAINSPFMNIVIEPAEQTIVFNNASNSTVEKGAFITEDATGKIKKSGTTGIGGITYASSNTSIATVDANGKVTGVAAGTAKITATLNKLGTSSYNANYQTIPTEKSVTVYEGMSLTWTKRTPHLKAESSTSGASAGSVTASSNSGNVTYKINTDTTILANKDGNLFQFVGAGLVADIQLKAKVTAAALANHGSNQYKVQLEATDANGKKTIDLVITIDDAVNDAYFSDGTAQNNKITNLSKVYGESSNTFQLYTQTLNGGNVTYSVDPSDTSGTVTISGTGKVTINKIGNATARAVIGAGHGYEGATISLPISITVGEQAIAFKGTTLNRLFVANSTFEEPAELRETSANTISTRTITYTSNSPTICTVSATGTVKMLKIGTCSIDASNKDSNWKSGTTVNKQIVLYDKMGISWSGVTPKLKAEANAIGNKAGTITVSGNQGIPTYTISSNTTAANYDKSFFEVIGSGPTVELKLLKAISAADWQSHTGTFKVQVDVRDANGTDTLDCIVQVDLADNTVGFTENNLAVTGLTKVFGETGNTFNLTSTSSNAGIAKYDIDATDTSGVVTVSDTGVVRINKVGTGKVKVDVASGNGFASGSISMNVTITKGEQAIAFKDTTTLNRLFVANTTFEESAILSETSANTVSSRGITYASKSPTICTVSASGTVTMLSIGTCSIDATNTDSNWKSATKNKQIVLYDKMGISWSDVSPKLKAEANAIGDKAGTITVSGNEGTPSYEISTNTTASNLDASFFEVIDNGTSAELRLKKKITAADWKTHTGKFYVQVDVIDDYGTNTKDIIVDVDAAENIVSFSESGTVITGLSKVYGEAGNTFNLTSKSSSSGSVKYSVDTSDTSGTLDVSDAGVVSIKAKGTGKVKAFVAANNGYADGSITMNVVVAEGEQTIAFTDMITLNRLFVANSTFEEPAVLSETSANTLSTRDITYEASATSVCTIDSDGTVTMLSLGTCNIKSFNKDSNWKEATKNKQIVLYDKMGISWSDVSPNLKAEANAIGDKAGMITVSGNEGTPSYEISSSTTASNLDASFFEVIDNGTTAELRLKKKITAADWKTHTGKFYVQVDVIDDYGTNTKDIIVDVDAAENIVSFSESGSVITGLSKVYGEAGNTFNLTSKSSSSGSVKYSVDTSDTSGTLDVSDAGVVTIKAKGTGKVKAFVAANNGYADGSITMNVVVAEGEQTIAFSDTTTLNRQFIANSTFAEAAILKETKANTLSTRIITYTSNDLAVCSVDASGTITMLSKGLCDVTASNSEANWKNVTTNKKINLYDGMGVSFAQTQNLQAKTLTTNKNAKAGDLSVSGGVGTKLYSISTDTGAYNKDASFFKVNSTGVVSFEKSVSASDLQGKYNANKKVYELYVRFEATDSLGTSVSTDAIVDVKGEPLKAEFDTNGTGVISEVFGAGKTFTLSLSSNNGNGTPTYQLKNDPSMPSDVLDSVDPTGLVTILHANDASFVGNTLKVEAVIPANDGYDSETIEVEVEITKATQPDFAFKTRNMRLGHGASVTPIFSGNLSSGSIEMSSGNNAAASINGSDINAKTVDGTAVITAIESGDRDYESAIATANVTVSSAPAYSLVIEVPTATYGDTGLVASIKFDGGKGDNKVQVWSSDDPTVAEIDDLKNITIHKAGTTTISCTQTSTGEPSVTAMAVLVVEPKPITITINDKRKYVGEVMPSFDKTIPDGVLVGGDTITEPMYSCLDTSNALVNDNTGAGTYPITGSYATGSNPNYNIKVTSGSLDVKQDASLASWYHLEGVASGSTLQANDWHKEDVKVVLDEAVESAGTYDEISFDKTLWDTSITLTNEGENNKDIYFRINTSNMLSTAQSTVIKIDKTNPVIKSITGTQTNKDDISQLINKLTFGAFFKPGTKVSIISEDLLPTANVKVSGVKEVVYNVYEIDKTTGKINENAKDSGTLTPDASGKSEVTLADVGMYRVCATTTDYAGNESVESCSDLNIKKIDVDVDKDNELDFNDPDGDDCPDLNIKWKQPDNEWVELNIDKDGDNIPEVNIDSTGDGIADINVDTDRDGKPDLNLVILKEWKPTFCVTNQKELYCTMQGIKPLINVDTGTDTIPDINIDTNGDMIADYNITKDGQVKPYLNIGKVHTTWNPDQDYKKDNFLFDSIGYHQPLLNIDTDNDGLPDVNIDFNDDGEPEINIDTSGDLIPDINIDSDGDGVANFNLDPDENGKPTKNITTIDAWTPALNGQKDGIAFDTMEIKRKDNLEDQGVTVEKPGGTFLPNYTIKVENIKDSVAEEIKKEIEEFIDADTEIKDIVDVKLFEDDKHIQPNEPYRVKIPMKAEWKLLKNIKVIAEQADGKFKEIEVEMSEDYITFEADYLGKISIVGDVVEEKTTPEAKPDIPIPNLKPATGGSTPNTSVKGEYTSNIGGAGTGDETSNKIFLVSIVLSFTTLLFLKIKKEKEES